MQLEILGANSVAFSDLVAAVSDAIGCPVDSANEYAAHFTAPDGTSIGVMPARAGSGPAIMYLLGPSDERLARIVTASLAQTHSWTVVPAAGSNAAA